MCKKWLGIIITSALSVVLLGVGPVSAGTCNATNELIIGSHQPLSGPSAASGIAYNRGLLLALKHYNEGEHPFNPEPCLNVAGKKYKLVNKVYDNKYTGEGGLAACKKLVFDDGVRFIIGTMGSGPSITCADAVTEPNKVIFLTSGWSTKVLRGDRKYTYRFTPTGREFGQAFWAWAKENLPQIKKVGVTGRNDDAGRGSVPTMRKVMRSFGYEVRDEPEWLDIGQTDYYPQLSRVLNHKPDMVNIINNPIEEGLQIKQLRELGWDGPIRGICQQPQQMMDTAGGKDVVEGVYCISGIDFDQGPPFITPEMSRIRNAHLAEFGDDLELQPLMVYDGTIGVLEAIKMAGTIDSEEVNKVFRNFNWKLSSGFMTSWGGKEALGNKGQLVQPVGVSQFQDGIIRVIGNVVISVP